MAKPTAGSGSGISVIVSVCQICAKNRTKQSKIEQNTAKTKLLSALSKLLQLNVLY
jgi:hypothetical protein